MKAILTTVAVLFFLVGVVLVVYGWHMFLWIRDTPATVGYSLFALPFFTASGALRTVWITPRMVKFVIATLSEVGLIVAGATMLVVALFSDIDWRTSEVPLGSCIVGLFFIVFAVVIEEAKQQ